MHREAHTHRENDERTPLITPRGEREFIILYENDKKMIKKKKEKKKSKRKGLSRNAHAASEFDLR